jgi:hypothetical protein
VNESHEPFKTFSLWLLALFLTALGAQLWMSWLYGSPLLMWDQWYEAGFFRDYASGHMTWSDLFASHNEHRMFASRMLDLTELWLNGRWEPLLQMTVNAFVHAAFACGLALYLWDFFGRKNGWLVCAILMVFFALPYWGENAIWGPNSLYYFTDIFGIVALAELGFGKTGSWRWWLGFCAAILGLFTTASGLLAPFSAGAVILLRAIKNRKLAKEQIISLVVCALVIALGLSLMVRQQTNDPLQAHNLWDFTMALTRNLSWPFYQAPDLAKFIKLMFPFTPILIGLPLAFVLAIYFRPKFPQPRAAEFLLGMALWSALQSATIAYGRGNYGDVVPPSRYSEFYNIFVIAAVFATILIIQVQERHRFPAILFALVYVTIIIYGLGNMSQIVINDLLAQTRMLNLVAEERVQRYLAGGSESEFLERPTIRPDPQLALTVMHDKDLQRVLPAICLPPASATTGRLWPLSQWLQEHSMAILLCGLILFSGLCGFGLARGKLGLTAMNPSGLVALLVCLAALGFVWSKHTVTRNSVEYQLQEQITANFKAAGNLKRAAIHDQKAEALKPFAN